VVDDVNPNNKWIGCGTGRQKDIIVPALADVFASFTWPRSEASRWLDFLNQKGAAEEQLDILYDRALDEEEERIQRHKRAVQTKMKIQDREQKITEADEETEMWRMKNKKDDWQRLNEGRSLVMREEYLGKDRQRFVESIEIRERRLKREKYRIHKKWSEEDNLHRSAESRNGAQPELFFFDVGRGRGRGRLDHNADFVPLNSQPHDQGLPPSYQLERIDHISAEPEKLLSQESDQTELLSPQDSPLRPSNCRNNVPQQFSSQGHTLLNDTSFLNDVNSTQAYGMNTSLETSLHEAYNMYERKKNLENQGDRDEEEKHEVLCATQKQDWDREEALGELEEGMVRLNETSPVKVASEAGKTHNSKSKRISQNDESDDSAIGMQSERDSISAAEENESQDTDSDESEDDDDPDDSKNALPAAKRRRITSTSKESQTSQESEDEEDEEGESSEEDEESNSEESDDDMQDADAHGSSSYPEEGPEPGASDDDLRDNDSNHGQASESDEDGETEASESDMQDVDAEESEGDSGSEAMDTVSDEEGFLGSRVDPNETLSPEEKEDKWRREDLGDFDRAVFNDEEEDRLAGEAEDAEERRLEEELEEEERKRAARPPTMEEMRREYEADMRDLYDDGFPSWESERAFINSIIKNTKYKPYGGTWDQPIERTRSEMARSYSYHRGNSDQPIEWTRRGTRPVLKTKRPPRPSRLPYGYWAQYYDDHPSEVGEIEEDTDDSPWSSKVSPLPATEKDFVRMIYQRDLSDEELRVLRSRVSKSGLPKDKRKRIRRFLKGRRELLRAQKAFNSAADIEKDGQAGKDKYQGGSEARPVESSEVEELHESDEELADLKMQETDKRDGQDQDPSQEHRAEHTDRSEPSNTAPSPTEKPSSTKKKSRTKKKSSTRKRSTTNNPSQSTARQEEPLSLTEADIASWSYESSPLPTTVQAFRRLIELKDPDIGQLRILHRRIKVKNGSPFVDKDDRKQLRIFLIQKESLLKPPKKRKAVIESKKIWEEMKARARADAGAEEQEGADEQDGVEEESDRGGQDVAMREIEEVEEADDEVEAEAPTSAQKPPPSTQLDLQPDSPIPAMRPLRTESPWCGTKTVFD
jgi:hypothetical protein